jgi:quinol monooxygenase YgiN
MSDAILYIDTSDVHEGALEELKPAIKRLADFVEANEPHLLAYNVYFSTVGTRMTVVSMHRDSASLEFHMKVAAPLFREFVELVTLRSIQIYGEPSEKVLEESLEKARLLGRGTVEVQSLHAGFSRIVTSVEPEAPSGT